MYEHVEQGIMAIIIALVCLGPLGVWKLVEIIIWVAQHVRVGLV